MLSVLIIFFKLYSGEFIIKADANEDGRQQLYFVMDSVTFYLYSKCSDQIDKDHKFKVLLSLGYAHIFPLTHVISQLSERIVINNVQKFLIE